MAIVNDPWGFQYDNSIPDGQYQSVKTSDGTVVQVDNKGSFSKSDPTSQAFFHNHVDKNNPGNVLKDNVITNLPGQVKNALGYGEMPKQPGVGGPAKDPSQLKQDPTTGMYYDPTSGTTYTDASGGTPVVNPNVAQQVASNFGVSRQVLGRTGASDAEHAQVMGGQNRLLGQLDNTITNVNAPSVAATQLAINNDRNSKNALGNASGVGGANAFAARRQALNSIAGGNAATAQNAALARAAEVASAQQQKGNVLGQQSTAGNQRYATDAASAAKFADTAMTGQELNQGLDQKQNEKDNENKQEFGKRVLGWASNLIGP